MFNAELLTSAKVQEFITLATKKKWDALQISTQLAKEFSNDELINKVNYFINKGISKKDAIEVVSELYNIRKNLLKDLIK